MRSVQSRQSLKGINSSKHKIRNLLFIPFYTKYQDEAIADIKGMENPSKIASSPQNPKYSIGVWNAFGWSKKGPVLQFFADR